MFTAVAVIMLLFPLASHILHLAKADPTFEQNLNDLITQMVSGIISELACSSLKEGASVLKEMTRENTYRANSSYHSCRDH